MKVHRTGKVITAHLPPGQATAHKQRASQPHGAVEIAGFRLHERQQQEGEQRRRRDDPKVEFSQVLGRAWAKPIQAGFTK